MIFDGPFNDGLAQLLTDRHLIVFNRSKVIRARITASSKLGEVDILVVGPFEGRKFKGLIENLRKYVVGDNFTIGQHTIFFSGREGAFGIFESGSDVKDILSEFGRPPIPPYIRGGKAVDLDYERYQNVYAKDPGSIAAPTAGLHFDENSFKILSQIGARTAYLTLHVGPSSIAEHLGIIPEKFEIPPETVDALTFTPVDYTVAVGTTTVRSLETFGSLGVCSGETSLVIEPGYEFKRVGKFFTNFHLPNSSHIKIVVAFLGLDQTIEAYNYAIKNRFRFFSYGDSMFCCP